MPTVDSSTIVARLRRARTDAVHASKSMPSLSLPSVELSSISMPHIDLPHIDLPHVEVPQIPALDEAGKAMGDAGRIMGKVLEAAGERLHDLRRAVSPQPKGTSAVRRGVVAVAVASMVGSLAAVVAFFLDPVRGAARRTAVRRRLRLGSGMARNGVDVARSGVDAARRAGDRAAELVRIPVESAREMVGGRNGHVEDGSDGAHGTAGGAGAESPLLVAASVAGVSGSNGSHEHGGTSAGLTDRAATNGTAAWIDPDAASAISGVAETEGWDAPSTQVDELGGRTEAEAVGE